MAIAATDAGADTAVQTPAAASSDTNAIFDILMAATVTPSTEGPMSDQVSANINADGSADAINSVAMTSLTVAPITSLTSGDMKIPDLASATPATQAFASDMEHMVQALAITAEVVAQGMAARTSPVHEIILTVEAPKAEPASLDVSPKLSAILPKEDAPSLTLKVSEADPQTNLDPALIALLPQVSKQNTTDETAPREKIIQNSQVMVVGSAPITIPSTLVKIAESPALQDYNETEPAHGPWRAELYGPFINMQKEVVTKPLFMALDDAPQTQMTTFVDSDVIALPKAFATSPISKPKMTLGKTADMPLDMSSAALAEKATPLQSAEEPIRPLTVHVPRKISETLKHDDEDDAQASDDDIPAPINHIERPILDTAIHVTPMSRDIDAHNLMPIVAQHVTMSVQPSLPEQSTGNVTDALQASRPDLPHMPHDLTAPIPQDSRSIAVTNTNNTHSFRPQSELQQVAEAEPAEINIENLSEIIRKNGDMSRMAHVQNEDLTKLVSHSETILTNAVAKTSSRSNANIRDLVKLGVRDIQIVQGTSSEQAMNVSPQVQWSDPNGAGALVRAQTADAFAPSGNDAGATERRAQAHEIRMRAIERQVVAAVRDGLDTVRMQLYPPGLGQIVIRLTMDGSKLKLTTNANSRDKSQEQSRSAKSENFALDMNA